MKHVVVNLDMRPEERWCDAVRAMRSELKTFGASINDHMQAQFHQWFPAVHAKTAWLLEKAVSVPEEMEREMRGIANHTAKYGLDYSKILLLNISLDYLSRCTAAVATCADTNDQVQQCHFRTLDWELDALRPLLMQVTFSRHGSALYTGWTFAGIVGLLTGMRHGAFSVSFNFRKTSKTNILQRLALGNSNFAGFVLRQALDQCVSFDKAQVFLTQCAMNASGYLVICGCSPGQGALVIKGPKQYDMCHSLSPYIVQTNHDPEMTTVDPAWAGDDPNLLTTLERQSQLVNLLQDKTAHGRTIQRSEMEAAMLCPPIQNNATMLTCTMVPAIHKAYTVPKVP